MSLGCFRLYLFFAFLPNSFPFSLILLGFPTNRLPPVAGRGGMDWLFSGGVAAKDVDDESVVNLVDFLYAVLDSLMKAVFL